MSSLPEIVVQNLDHLGLVAGLIDEIGIVERINQLVGEKPGEMYPAISSYDHSVCVLESLQFPMILMHPCRKISRVRSRANENSARVPVHYSMLTKLIQKLARNRAVLFC
jgi:hypothetical protein